MSAVAGAIAFLWLGMVLALSFLEAPLKFRAPGITVQLGLGIGRLVFAALNRIEVLLLVGVTATLLVAPAPTAAVWATGLLAALLLAQLLVVKPALTRRSDRVLAGESPAPSRAHIAYIGLESVKVVTLFALGTSALANLKS